MFSTHKSLSKGEKRLIVVCALATLPIMDVTAYYHVRDADPEWNIPLAPITPRPNGYDFYVAAARKATRFNPTVDPITDSNYALKNYSLVRRRAWLKANSDTFSLLHQGLVTPCSAPDFPNDQGDKQDFFDPLALAISVRTRTLQMQHQPMQATMSALDGMQMVQDVTREGGLIARLAATRIMEASRAPLEDWNKTINLLSADEARFASHRLEEILSRESTPKQTRIAQKRVCLLELQRMFSINNWRVPPKPSPDLCFPPSEEEEEKWERHLRTVTKREVYERFEHYLDASIANSQLPYSQARKVPNPGRFEVALPSFTIENYIMFDLEAHRNTSNNMLMLRLALRAYIAKQGKAPLNLASLVPYILKCIPKDIYSDGKPLFYKPRGKTYTLWSVGEDGINNGGVPFPRRLGDDERLPVSSLLRGDGDFVAGLCR